MEWLLSCNGFTTIGTVSVGGGGIGGRCYHDNRQQLTRDIWRGSGASRFQLVLIGLDCTTKDNSVLVVVVVAVVTVPTFANPAKRA